MYKYKKVINSQKKTAGKKERNKRTTRQLKSNQ